MAEEVQGKRFKPESVFDVATGEEIFRQPIDCKELVASGFYSYTKPQPKPEVEPEVEPAPSPRRGKAK